MSFIKTSFFIIGVSLAIAIIGTSAMYHQHRSIANDLIDMSRSVDHNWRYLSRTLDLHRAQTGRGELEPILRPAHDALDLVVYGHMIAQPMFQDDFKIIYPNNLIGQINISNKPDGSLRYTLNNIELADLSFIDNHTSVISYINVPLEIAKHIENIIDNEHDLEKGNVQLKQFKTGANVLTILNNNFDYNTQDNKLALQSSSANNIEENKG